MKVREKVKKQGYSKEEREYVDKLLTIFRKKGEHTTNSAKGTIDVLLKVPKTKKVDIPASAKVAPIEKEEEGKYKNQFGSPEEYTSDNLEEFLYLKFCHLQDLFNLLNMEEDYKVIDIGQSLLRDAWCEIEKTCEMIEKQVGKIEVDYQDSSHIGHIGRRLLGISITPAEVEQAKEA